ncbi:LIM domain-containing protein [Rhodotorula toruloides ATCC 204091]|uniref:LIM domain-containing protein n=1 Tax=Rhodotorula toruloides TaxID=5286 RepID=A0A0K3CS04_RHOTO|nr:LIM domain-containing protein [Rhodotorula toruloides ATCC 204091]PRQ69786.1 LIM domain-containing protein [Rhodotorula toruloides]
MTGQFVRALGTVYHLDCFRCMDCGKMVAAKFFPIDASDGSGRQVPLCETDYFRRLNLLCAKCGQALRGSYITALDMKFHVEHFTCEVCPTVFGPHDSYYEHDGSVYCHFHYSTRFAVKCTGCRTAILKQFVEINRNSVDEHWHPECYMIHKFWNIKLAPTPKAVEALPPPDSSDPSSAPVPDSSTSAPPSPEYLAIEASETPGSLKGRQKHMEEQVYRIWTILSAFEESSAACISEMLRHVSSGYYMEGVGMAEKFVLHVETLFAAIDDLNEAFRRAGAKELQHVREARMLCKKVVNFFMLLSHTHETGARKMSVTQDLLSLVTGLAHYLKILIRIALAGSLKLEREHGNVQAIALFLGRLDRLARDPEANKISATMLALARKGGAWNASSARAGLGPATSTAPNRKDSDQSAASASGDEANGVSHVAPVLARPTYGYKSLARAIGTLVGQGEATTDLCEGCRLTIEEECVRRGTSIRWHLPCLRCAHCQRLATKDDSTASAEELPLADFVWVPAGGEGGQGATVCKECARRERGGSLEGTVDGFAHVTRLEQYAFLLCVALNKLYGRLKQRGVVPGTPPDGEETRSLSDAYRDSSDIKRMKSVQLDRKLSATTARVPQRSTVIQSPSGRTAQSDATDPTFQLFQAKPPVPSRKDQPLVDPVRGTTIPRSQVREVVPTSSGHATPTPSNAVTPTPSPGLAGPAPLPPSATLPAAVQRPHFNRATTAVRIVDDPPPRTEDVPSGGVREPEGLGGTSEPTKDEEGLTLADLPKALEAEQKRAAAPDKQARRSPLSDPREQSQPYASPANNGPKLLSELSALEYFIVKHVSAVLLSSETSALCDVAPLDDLLDIIDARKNTFWGKLFKAGGEKKKVPKKGVFGIPLEVLVERNGADSMHGAGPDMSIEGIFRKNGNIRRLKDLTEALDRDASSVNLSDENPVQLAALLKKFLRDLPDPLMTFKLFHLFIAAQRVDDPEARKKALHYCCCMMPKAHRDTMEVIFVFLKWVASFSHVDEETGSKMDLQNLATVISPNILYAKGKDPARDESFSAARVVHDLLELQDEFWEVPAECLSILNDQELFSNPSQLTSKEILARAENHIRLNGRATHWKVSRGEASPPRRPGLQEAWSAPAIPGGGGGSRPISTYASPSPFRSPERPTSYSNQPSSGGGGGPNAIGAPQPWSSGSSPWPPAPPPEDRFEAPYRRGTEATGSSSSLHRQAHSESGQPSFPSHPMPHTSSSHPYQRAAGR